jgi:hypothetical protein
MIARPPRGFRPFVATFLAICLFLPVYNRSIVGNQPPLKTYGEYIQRGVEGFRRNWVNKSFNNTLYQPGNEYVVHKEWNFTSPCSGFPDMDGILLVMKTGVTEAFDKMPTQLLTTLQCLPDFLLFSDMVWVVLNHRRASC